MEMKPYGRQAPIYNLMVSGQAKVLAENDTGILVRDKESGVLFLDQPDVQTAREWLERCRHQPYLLCIAGSTEARQLAKDLDLEAGQDCVQCVYDRPEQPYRTNLQIVPAQDRDLDWIKDRYDLMPEEAEQGQLFKVVENGVPIAFGGLHPEQSIGFLYVEPTHRRRGIAKALEQFLIRRQMQRGLVPYAHIFSDNTESLRLQHKCGMTFCPDRFVWCRNIVE